MTQAEVIAALEKEGYEYLRLAVSEEFTYQEGDSNGTVQERRTGLRTFLLFNRSHTKSWVNTYESIAVPLDPSGRAEEVLHRVSATGV